MPFQQLPIPGTYIDVSKVTDIERERLKITFENSMVVMLRVDHDDYRRPVLVVDKTHSDPAALEAAYQQMHDTQSSRKSGRTILGITIWKQTTNLSLQEVREQLLLEMSPDYREMDSFNRIAVGHRLGLMATLQGGGEGVILADHSLVASIESVVVD